MNWIKMKQTHHIGVGLGIVVIFTRLIAAPIITASPEVMLSYGIFTGMIFPITLFFSIFLFGFVGKRIRNQSVGDITIADFLKRKLKPFDFKIFITLILLLMVQGLLIQVTIINNLLYHQVPAPLPLLFISLYFLGVFLVVARGIWSINRLAQWQTSIFLAVVILAPIYHLIQKGMDPVYAGIHLYHPYILILFQEGSFSFICISVLIGCGYIFLNPSLWQRLFQLKVEKVRRTFFLTSLIWCVIPISIIYMFLLIIYHGSFQAFSDIPLNIIETGNSVMLFLLFLGVSMALTASFSSELHSILTIVQKSIFEDNQLSKKKQSKYGFIIGLALILLTIALYIYYKPTFLEIFLFGGVIQVALLPQIILLIFQQNHYQESFATGSLLGLLFGYVIYFAIDPLVGIAFSFFCSVVVTFGLKLYIKFKFRKENLKMNE